MRKSYREFLERLKERLVGPDGDLPADVRQSIIDGRILDEPLNAFVVRVRANASSLTQRDIDALKARGLSEDEIFEATICAAFVSGLERYQMAMKALQEASDAS
jgi:hypothetical protein